jgi:hypothetical protein
MIKLKFFAILLLIICIIVSSNSCFKKSKINGKAFNFYQRYKVNNKFDLLGSISIQPYRDLITISNNIYFKKYDTSSIKNIELYKPLLNKEYISNYFSTDIELKKYIHKYYQFFKELDILAVYGFEKRGYIKFIITNQDVLVYIIEQDHFNKEEFIKANDLKEIVLTYLDENWIYYRLPIEKEYTYN